MIADESSLQFGGEKIFRHFDKLAAWQAGELLPPVTVELDLTNLCNHSCPGCTFSYLVNIVKEQVPFDRAKDIVRQLGEFGVKAITFSGGGEPLVYGQDRVVELMTMAKSYAMDVALITNGSLLTDVRLLDLCTWIRVSLDGYDDETYRRFHGRGAKELAKVVDRLNAIGAAKLQSDSACTLGVGFLTDRDSTVRGDFYKGTELAARITGLDYVQFRPLVANMIADPSLTGGYEGYSQAEFAAVLTAHKEAKRAFARSNFRVLLSSDKYQSLARPGFGREYDSCHAHFLEAVISADSKVYLCCHTQGQEQFCLGDLGVDSFAAIWHSQRAAEVAANFNPKTTCPPACRLHPQNTILEGLSVAAVHPNFI